MLGKRGVSGVSSGERASPREAGGPNSKSGGMGGPKYPVPPVTKRGVSRVEGAEDCLKARVKAAESGTWYRSTGCSKQ